MKKLLVSMLPYRSPYIDVTIVTIKDISCLVNFGCYLSADSSLARSRNDKNSDVTDYAHHGEYSYDADDQ